MPSITVDKKDFLTSLTTDLSDDDIMHVLSQLGVEVEDVTDDDIDIEVFPNRPDLLSLQGLLRNVKGLLEEETGLPSYKVSKSDYEVLVEDSVQNIRPKTSCVVATDISLDKAALDNLITLQEKIHVTYGRGREKCALGLYPLDHVSFPITYKALPPDAISFTPLGQSYELTGQEILDEHPKGKQYRTLLEEKDRFSVFIDNSNDFLSMPPIINSKHTGEVTPETTDLFIECSGFDQDVVNRALNIVSAHLYDLGSKINRVRVSYSEKTEQTPTIDETDTTAVSVKKANKWLGKTMSADSIVSNLEKMRHDAKKSQNGKIINVSNPTYRTDLIGETDFYEEIAIGHGYNNIEPDEQRVYTRGSKDRMTKQENHVRDILIGSGYQELYTFSLCEAENIQQVTRQSPVTLKNSLSERYNALRPSLIPNHLSTLSDNTHYAYPQKLFEIGPAFFGNESEPTNVEENQVLTVTISGSERGFSQLQELIVTVAERMELPLSFEAGSHPAMIDGRTASMITKNNDIGVLGEIHPAILTEYDLNNPTCICEISLTKLLERNQNSK